MNASILCFLIAATLLLSACSKPEGANAEAMSDDAGVTPKIARAVIDTQEVKAPCDWLTREEVAGILGPPAGEAYRVLDAENVRPNAGGDACAYPVTSDRGVADVAVQVDLQGAPQFEAAEAMMVGVVARELSEGGHGEAPENEKRTDGWDVVGWFAGERLHRMGHVAIRIGDRASVAKEESLDRIANLLREKIADKPFANPRSDANAASDEGPCALLTRAEAEAVLGPLAVPPYRSLFALADSNGPSCTYYAAGHRAFVVHPTYYDGKEEYQMVVGLGSLVRSGLGGADEGDLLDGPWDAATAGSAGELIFLKGDTMLKVIYRTSATDIAGAAKLAASAMPRLAVTQ